MSMVSTAISAVRFSMIPKVWCVTVPNKVITMPKVVTQSTLFPVNFCFVARLARVARGVRYAGPPASADKVTEPDAMDKAEEET